ncbi:MAG: CPBP family glutamic-type intramembrane protease [Dysgonomonas sp.]|nr:CPBP family glutamic-type intramembrane protease [Dysgonomonas sp.]
MKQTNTTYIQSQMNNRWGLFFIHYLLLLLKAILVISVIHSLNITLDLSIKNYTFLREIIQYAIIHPIIETLIFQLLIKYILDKLKLKNFYLILIIMTLLFTIAHGYFQPLLFLNLLFTCTIINIYYLKMQKKESTQQAALYTIILHALNNFTYLIIDKIESVLI